MNSHCERLLSKKLTALQNNILKSIAAKRLATKLWLKPTSLCGQIVCIARMCIRPILSIEHSKLSDERKETIHWINGIYRNIHTHFMWGKCIFEDTFDAHSFGQRYHKRRKELENCTRSIFDYSAFSLTIICVLYHRCSVITNQLASAAAISRAPFYVKAVCRCRKYAGPHTPTEQNWLVYFFVLRCFCFVFERTNKQLTEITYFHLCECPKPICKTWNRYYQKFSFHFQCIYIEQCSINADMNKYNCLWRNRLRLCGMCNYNA